MASDQRPVESWGDGHESSPVRDFGDQATRDAIELQRQIHSRSGHGHRRPPKRQQSMGSFFKELPVLLLIAFALAFLLRTFVVQVFYIPSESMLPTLQVDDRIVVEKVTYRFGGPERGDVVVFAGESPFPEPEMSTTQRVIRGVGQFLGVVPVDARDLVKRVIGLPGDHVVVEDGRVSVNGTPLEEPYARLDEHDGAYTVPEGNLFVLGDNRANSADSRSQLGYVPVADVVGRAVVTIWPLDRLGAIEGADYQEVGDAPVFPDSSPSPAALDPAA